MFLIFVKYFVEKCCISKEEMDKLNAIVWPAIANLCQQEVESNRDKGERKGSLCL